jgi:hypothetical protein
VGGEQNYYYAELDTQQPCLFYEGYPVLPQTSNNWTFISSGFARTVPVGAFGVPAGCTDVCDVSGMSYKERLQARWRAGVGGNLVRNRR